RRRLFTSQRGIPVPGVSLLAATLWLGVVPLAVYAASFGPAYFMESSTLTREGLIGLHREMLALQGQVLEPHTYQSNWGDWVLNLRAIWYYYEAVDGVQRGILLLGNPLTMLLGLPALVWCAVTGATQREWVRSAVVAGYAVSLGLWLVAEKSVQFFYHYFVPQFFLLAALALALDAIWRAGNRRIPIAILAGSTALFAWFFPIMSAAALDGPMSFLDYAWIEGWR
ncbi:MAG: phospholipid carrier-dependent glycosyltransferase, partial [Sphingomonadales bacterium]